MRLARVVLRAWVRKCAVILTIALVALQGCCGSSPRAVPAQAAAIAFQCKPYTGMVCAGVVNYDYFQKTQENDESESTVREALKRVEVRHWRRASRLITADRVSCTNVAWLRSASSARARSVDADEWLSLLTVCLAETVIVNWLPY